MKVFVSILAIVTVILSLGIGAATSALAGRNTKADVMDIYVYISPYHDHTLHDQNGLHATMNRYRYFC